MMLGPRVRLLISLGVGGVSVACLFLFLQQSKKNFEATVSMTPVVLVKKYVKQGAVLTEDMVEESLVPEAYRQPTALTSKAQLRDEQGRCFLKSRIGLLKGEQLTLSKLLDDRTFVGLAWTLEPDTTAVTLKLTPERAVGGLLQPGDRVNIFCTLSPQTGWPKPETALLLSYVRVLAVQQDIWNPYRSIQEKIGSKTVANEPILVTIGLSTKEAVKLVLADDRGEVTLSLLSPIAAAVPPRFAVTLTDLH